MASTSDTHVTIPALQQMKRDGKKSVGVVAWDYQIARIAERAGVDFVSVGDSVGVNLWGHANPLEVTLDEMLVCCKAVRRGVDARAGELRRAVRAGAGRRRQRAARRHPAGQGRRRRHGQGRRRGRFPRGGDGAHPRRHPGVRAVRADAADRAEIRHPLQRAEFAPARRRPPETTAKLVEEAKMLEDAGAVALDFTNSGPVAGAAVVKAVKIPVIGGFGGGPWLDGRVRMAHTAIGYAREVDRLQDRHLCQRRQGRARRLHGADRRRPRRPPDQGVTPWPPRSSTASARATR